MDKKTLTVSIIVSILLTCILFEVPPLEQPLANAGFYDNIYFTSPLNMTYYTNQIQINIELESLQNNTTPSVKAWYSLDGQTEVPLPLVYEGVSTHDGNAMPHHEFNGVTDLPTLSDGTHSITAFGEFDFGTYILRSNVTATFAVTTNSTNTVTKTIVVPDDYLTIQTAILSANDGETVFVKGGNYTESVEINKSISLIGEESKTTVITAPAGDVFSSQTIKVSADDVKILNLTVNNYNVLGFGISTIGNATEIIGNTVNSQTAISANAPFTTISENIISGYYISVEIGKSHCNVTNNTITSDGISVDLEGSSNLVSGNRITGHPTYNDTTGYGILINGNSNSVSDNLIEGEDDGIRVGSYESNNVVTANSVANCSDTGLRIDRWGFNNTCSGNNVTECKYGVGVDLGAYNNTIYQNNFVNNVQQAFASQPDVFNYWDNGKEGNYWSDFSKRYPNATEIDSSGVWDTPYVIKANNTDDYPLTMPYGTLAPLPEQEPFPTLVVVAVIIIAFVVAVSILVYFKKRKQGRHE